MINNIISLILTTMMSSKCFPINNKIVSIREEKNIKYYEEKFSKKITTESAHIAGVKEIVPIILVAENNNNEKIGGLIAYEYYGSLQIDILWIEKEYRRKGIGEKLLTYAETIARSKDLKMITLSTMEWWNAKYFYEKQGYNIEFIRDGFEKGYKQIHFKKILK